MIHPLREAQLSLQTRRAFLSSVGQFSLGAIALHAMQTDALGASSANDNPLAPRKPHFKAKAKRVIYLHMSGGPPDICR